MNKIDKQLKKGVLDILILSLLSKNESLYGYKIIKMLTAKSNEFFSLKEGSLYPVLYRLEDKGLIENEIIYQQTKRSVPRKYYSITKLGLDTYQEYLRSWQDFVFATNQVLEG